MACIYKITNLINNKIYIGQTRKDISNRKARHKYAYKKVNTYLYRSMLKYGFENFKFDVVEELDFDREKLNNLEIKYIKEFDSINSKIGYNLTKGGDYPDPFKSEEHKRKIGLANRGKSYSKGIPKSKEHVDNVRKSLIKYYESNKHSKGVLCFVYDLNNNLLFKFNSINKTTKTLGISFMTFHKLINNNPTRFKYNFKIKIQND